MEEGGVKLSCARPIALQIAERLRLVCDRCEIAGSVRRGKADVGDIEIVCIPATSPSGVRKVAFAVHVKEIGRIVKGDPCLGKYVQVWHPAGIAVDVFTAIRNNWGLIYAVRTGSAHYSHKVLACGWVRAGYHSMGGMLCTKTHKIPVREEADLFELIGIPWVPPEART